MNLTSDRRTFLRMGALAAAATQLPLARAFAAPASGPSPIHLGMASYTFREFPRARVIEWMKQLHLTTINCKDVKDHLPSTSAADEQAAVDDYRAAGISVTAVGTIYFPKDEDDDIRTKFEYAKKAGATVIVAGDPKASILPRIEKFVKEYNIKFAIHNHGPEDAIWHSPLDVLAAVQGMDPRMGCCIDVGHTMRAGTDPVDAVRKAGPRLFNMHMKDLAKADAKDSQVAVGEGIMPVRQIFQALIDQKYKGNVDLEYEIHGDDPMPGVIKTFASMRATLAAMGYTA